MGDVYVTALLDRKGERGEGAWLCGRGTSTKEAKRGGRGIIGQIATPSGCEFLLVCVERGDG